MRERSSTVQRELAATPAEIWAYRLDFRNLPAYNSDVKNLERLAEGDAGGVGATYRFDLTGPGGAFPVELEVTRTEPDRVVAIEMRGALPAAEVFTVEALDARARTSPARRSPSPSRCASRTSSRPGATTAYWPAASDSWRPSSTGWPPHLRPGRPGEHWRRRGTRKPTVTAETRRNRQQRAPDDRSIPSTS